MKTIETNKKTTITSENKGSNFMKGHLWNKSIKNSFKDKP